MTPLRISNQIIHDTEFHKWVSNNTEKYGSIDDWLYI
jgi:hypothetical protein